MPGEDDILLKIYKCFDEKIWKEFSIPKTHLLTAADLSKDPEIAGKIEQEELSNIYCPLIQFILENYKATRELKLRRSQFLKIKSDQASPFMIGLAGSVGVGKSTTTLILKTLLRHLPEMKVNLVSTDNFLYSNAELEKKGLMDEKGFPSSYNIPRLLDFLDKIHRNQSVSTPLYSHEISDVSGEVNQIVDQPDIVILEGLNILQSNRSGRHDHVVAVSDYLDFTLYLDAPTQQIERWYIQRFQNNIQKARASGTGHYHKYIEFSPKAVEKVASLVWKYVNLKNLECNILPTKYLANCILEKGLDHRIRRVYLRNTL